MSNGSVIVLWVYIVLLLAGGMMGFIKARSKISLITSSAFGLLLALCALRVIPYMLVADALIALLAIVFVVRYNKSRKFMPAGLMVILSVAALLALCFLR